MTKLEADSEVQGIEQVTQPVIELHSDMTNGMFESLFKRLK